MFKPPRTSVATLLFLYLCCLTVFAEMAPNPKEIKLPLRFEPAANGEFVARGGGYAVQISATEAVIQTPAGPLTMRMNGASRAARGSGHGQLPGVSNYYVGDPRTWRTAVPNYSSVRFAKVYPGVDVRYYGLDQRLEFDLIVAPGADASQLSLSFPGASVTRTGTGGLAVARDKAKFEMLAPVAYQVVDGKRVGVRSEYRIAANGTVAFRLGSYDRERELVIDPVILRATHLGGEYLDFPMSIATDSQGNIYVAGLTFSNSFPTTSGALQRTPRSACESPNCANAFVAKLSPDLSTLLYSTYLGGSREARADGIAVDANGNAYITGGTNSPDFPVTSNAFQRVYRGPVGDMSDFADDAFVTKINANGSLGYSSFLGGSRGDRGMKIDVMNDGTAFVAGVSSSFDLSTTPGVVQPQHATNYCTDNCFPFEDTFVARISSGGSHLQYLTYLGGGDWDLPEGGIVVDEQGNTYLAGRTYSRNFPTTPNAYRTTKDNNLSDVYVTKLNVTATALVYSTYFGSLADIDSAGGIAVNPAGEAIVTGWQPSGVDPEASPFPLAEFAKPGRAYVFKLSATGSSVPWVRVFGPGVSRSLILDKEQRIWITGHQFAGDQFTQTPGMLYRGGAALTYLLRMSRDAARVEYSTFINAGDTTALAMAPNSDIYVVGHALGPGITTAGAFQREKPGGDAGFVMAIRSCPLKTTSPSVTICLPPTESMVNRRMFLEARTRSGQPVTAMKVYVDDTSVFSRNGSRVETVLQLNPGRRRVTVNAWTASTVFSSTAVVNVTPLSCPVIQIDPSITICRSNIAGGFLELEAGALSSRGITDMAVYVDYALKLIQRGNYITPRIEVGSGCHLVTVKAWDTAGNIPTKRMTLCTP